MHYYSSKLQFTFGVCFGPINHLLVIPDIQFIELCGDDNTFLSEQKIMFIAPDKIKFLSSGVVKKIKPEKVKDSAKICVFCFDEN